MQRSGGSGYAISRGALKHGIMVVAEALGEEEAAGSSVLIGKTGKFWDRILSRIKDPETQAPLSSDDFLHTNILRCRPPDNKLVGRSYEKPAIEKCSPYLREFIKQHKPKVILTLGNTPLKWFTGLHEIKKARGYVYDTPFGLVIPTYHPSFLTRGNFGLTRLVQLDIKKALYVARHGKIERKKNYILRPTPLEVENFMKEFEAMPPDTALSFDIETPYASVLKDDEIDPEAEEINLEDDPSYKIDRISFAFKDFHAITMVWMPPYTTYIRRLLASNNPKIVWNGLNFDIPRVEFNDAPVGGLVYDGMDMWHFKEPSFPMGLKSAATVLTPDMEAWGLLSNSRPEYYSCADSDVARRCVLKIKDMLDKDGKFATFEQHFVRLGFVLRKMSRRGILVDKEKRRDAREKLLEELDALNSKIQETVPIILRPRQIFKKSEEALKKPNSKGSVSWEEGRMIKVILQEPRKHEHVWECQGASMVKCVGCSISRKKPKKSFCTCGTCPVKEKKMKETKLRPDRVCNEHPTYGAKRKPRTECEVCWKAWREKNEGV